MDLFRAVHYLYNLSHISYNDETRHSYTLPQHFFYRKSTTFVMSRNTDIAFLYKNSHSFYFFLVFKGCFNKHGCDFDDVSKIGYSRPS